MSNLRAGSGSFVTLVVVLSLAACSSDDGKPTLPLGSDDADSGAPAADGGPADGGGTAAKKKNAEGPCADGAECESGVCFVGGNQSYCALRCTAENGPTLCSAPFTGSCNKQGYCKRD